MKISFVILNYNRGVELIETVRLTKEMMSGADDYEIIVIDNASTDNSITLLKTIFPDVSLISRKLNNGVAGWNDGFTLAAGEYIVVLDDDSNIITGLSGAVQYLDNNPQIGILALNITGGAFQTKNQKEWVDKEPCLSFIGCGAIIKSELIRKIGGFSEWLFIYAHEHEYAIRCYDQGYEIRFFSGCRVLHRTSSINRTNERLTVYTVRNEMGIVYKYFSYNRWKFIIHILINRLKTIQDSGFKTGWYVSKGFFAFLALKSTLPYTPVSNAVQANYAQNFWSLRPIWKKSKI